VSSSYQREQILLKKFDLLFVLDGIVSQISSGQSTSYDFHSDAEFLSESFDQRVLFLYLQFCQAVIGVSDTGFTSMLPQVVSSDELAESADRILL
jgi:hypothetical protein